MEMWNKKRFAIIFNRKVYYEKNNYYYDFNNDNYYWM